MSTHRTAAPGARATPRLRPVPAAPEAPEAPALVACSVCLRVRRGPSWVEAEVLIRQLRSYARPAPPRLHPALCPRCAASLRRRRTPAPEPLAA